MTRRQIDTVRTGGRYDSNHGVLAGLEAVRALTTGAMRHRVDQDKIAIRM